MTEPMAPNPAGPRADVLPLITLRDMIIFPGAVKPFIVGRPASLSAVEPPSRRTGASSSSSRATRWRRSPRPRVSTAWA